MEEHVLQPQEQTPQIDPDAVIRVFKEREAKTRWRVYAITSVPALLFCLFLFTVVKMGSVSMHTASLAKAQASVLSTQLKKQQDENDRLVLLTSPGKVGQLKHERDQALVECMQANANLTEAKNALAAIRSSYAQAAELKEERDQAVAQIAELKEERDQAVAQATALKKERDRAIAQYSKITKEYAITAKALSDLKSRAGRDD